MYGRERGMILVVRPWFFVGLGLICFLSAAFSRIADNFRPNGDGRHPIKQPRHKISTLIEWPDALEVAQ